MHMALTIFITFYKPYINPIESGHRIIYNNAVNILCSLLVGKLAHNSMEKVF